MFLPCAKERLISVKMKNRSSKPEINSYIRIVTRKVTMSINMLSFKYLYILRKYECSSVDFPYFKRLS